MASQPACARAREALKPPNETQGQQQPWAAAGPAGGSSRPPAGGLRQEPLQYLVSRGVGGGMQTWEYSPVLLKMTGDDVDDDDDDDDDDSDDDDDHSHFG